MTKKKRLAMILTIVLVAVLAAGIGAYAASNYGSSSDPLVTLSYLNGTYFQNVLTEVQNTVGDATTESYKVVTLAKGQTLLGKTGCEVMLRSGSASCTAGSDASMTDTTAGAAITSGALTMNHLYIITSAEAGIRADAESVLLLVRGSYAVS